MKIRIFIILVLQFLMTQLLHSAAEITITNKSNETLKFVVYPIGAIFNGTKEYNLRCVVSSSYTYIFGGQKSGITLNQSFTLDQDREVNANGEASIGFGKYRIVFYKLNSGYDSVNYCDLDFSDSDYPYNGDPYLTKDLTLEYNSSTNITYHFGGGTVSIPGSKLITSWDQRTSGNTNAYKTQNKNGFISSTTYSNWPINAIDDGAVNHTYLNEVYVNLLLRDNGINIITNKTLKFINSIFTIKDTTTFTMNSGSTLYMDGGNFRTFQTNGLKTITVGNGALINMYIGSAINLSKTKFQLAGGASSWRGIKTTNSLSDTIANCEFNGADTCLSIYNSDKCWALTKKMIFGNTINSGYMLLRNVFQIYVSQNTFSMGSKIRGLEISNSVHPSDLLECIDVFPENPFSINIDDNHFSGGNSSGNVQLLINNLAADLTPVYIKANEFQGSTNNFYGIWTIKTSGDIIGNIFSSSDYDRAIVSYESELNLLGNELRSNSFLDVHILEESSYLMAPLFSDDKYYWYGGSNILESADQNIEFDEGSEVFLDNGFNCLTGGEYTNIGGVLASSSGYCLADQPYSVRNNYWSPLPPNSGIYCSGGGPLIDLQYIPYNNECATEPENIIDFEIIDRGDGLIDTIWISEEAEEESVVIRNRSGGNISSSEREDEELLTQSILNKYRKNHDDAISELKNLIDNYDTSRFVYRALGELYINYSLSDTGTIQSNTTSLFNNLKDYLEDKIEQYELNYSFLQKAYSYYLMCLTKTLDYNEAILGYENIMENHPDTTRRLLASWDRSANVLLQEGSGGGDNNLNDNQKLEKLFKDKPVHLLVKNAFKKMASTFNSSKSINGRNDIKNLSGRIIRFNPETRAELDSKISKDMEDFIFSKNQGNFIQNILPTEYKLNQNYPNPFNPVTTISYELPTNGFVKMKVYDVSGKEIMSLVNEYKVAGNYSIKFDGTNLSSGVYFYKLKAGKTEMVRKMILIK